MLKTWKAALEFLASIPPEYDLSIARILRTPLDDSGRNIHGRKVRGWAINNLDAETTDTWESVIESNEQFSLGDGSCYVWCNNRWIGYGTTILKAISDLHDEYSKKG